MLALILSILATVGSVGAVVTWITENIEEVFSGAASLFGGATVEGVLLGIVIGFTVVFFLRKSRAARRARAEEESAGKAGAAGSVSMESEPLRRMNGME